MLVDVRTMNTLAGHLKYECISRPSKSIVAPIPLRNSKDTNPTHARTARGNTTIHVPPRQLLPFPCKAQSSFPDRRALGNYENVSAVLAEIWSTVCLTVWALTDSCRRSGPSHTQTSSSCTRGARKAYRCSRAPDQPSQAP